MRRRWSGVRNSWASFDYGLESTVAEVVTPLVGRHLVLGAARLGVHPGFGVGTVWRGDYAVGGWKCSLGLGEAQGRRQGLTLPGGPLIGRAQGRHKACPYRTVWGGWQRRWASGGGGQAQGLPLPGRLGGILLARHVAGEELARWRVRGGRCGGAAPAQGRAEGPTAQLQWSVVSGQRRHFPCLRADRGLAMVGSLPEGYEGSLPFWDASRACASLYFCDLE